jgi:hypothetical protein
MDPQVPSEEAIAATNETPTTANHDDLIAAPLQIGDTCQIVWRDGTTELSAEVIERRRAPVVHGGASGENTVTVGSDDEPSAKRSKIDLATADDDANDGGASSNSCAVELSAGDFLYYVHYLEHDR